MSTHWIKVEKDTPHKPELRQAAKRCGVKRADAFLAFFQLWSFFDTHCVEGFLPGFTAEEADEIAGLRGFAAALVAAGWITFDPTGLTISNWDRHNGRSAKARAQTMRRVQAHRARKRWDPARTKKV